MNYDDQTRARELLQLMRKLDAEHLELEKRRAELLRQSRCGRHQWRKANQELQEILRRDRVEREILPAVGPEIQLADLGSTYANMARGVLKKLGVTHLNQLEALRQLSDRELYSLPGLGRKTLRAIRYRQGVKYS